MPFFEAMVQGNSLMKPSETRKCIKIQNQEAQQIEQSLTIILIRWWCWRTGVHRIKSAWENDGEAGVSCILLPLNHGSDYGVSVSLSLDPI